MALIKRDLSSSVYMTNHSLLPMFSSRLLLSKPQFNPYHTPVCLKQTEVSVTVPSAPRRPGDRSRTILGRVWVGMMDPHSQGPTSRRRVRSLGLGVAPASTVVNVPTQQRGAW